MPNSNRWRTGLRMDGLGPPRPHATMVSRVVASGQVELPTDSVRVLEGDVVLVEGGVELHARVLHTGAGKRGGHATEFPFVGADERDMVEAHPEGVEPVARRIRGVRPAHADSRSPRPGI